jgi:hypothetical protein
MIDFLAYGAIGIAMACAILSYRLLLNEQKKADPNESVLKMIKLFIGLTVFFALFFGVIELFKDRGNRDLTVQAAADYLKNVDSSTYVLNSQPGSQKANVVLNYGDGESVVLGGLLGDSTKNLNAKKSKDGTHWDIFFGETPLGEIETEWIEYRLFADSTNGKEFKEGEWYPINDSDLWFRINEISGRSPNYIYNVSYAEGSSVSELVVARKTIEYSKTDNGYIFLNQDFARIHHDKWTRQYYVKFGAGLALKGAESVQKLNVHVIAVAVK